MIAVYANKMDRKRYRERPRMGGQIDTEMGLIDFVVRLKCKSVYQRTDSDATSSLLSSLSSSLLLAAGNIALQLNQVDCVALKSNLPIGCLHCHAFYGRLWIVCKSRFHLQL